MRTTGRGSAIINVPDSKNMHLAFVNTGNSSGMVRFSEIGIGATPVKCNGFTAVLTADDCSER